MCVFLWMDFCSQNSSGKKVKQSKTFTKRPQKKCQALGWTVKSTLRRKWNSFMLAINYWPATMASKWKRVTGPRVTGRKVLMECAQKNDDEKGKMFVYFFLSTFSICFCSVANDNNNAMLNHTDIVPNKLHILGVFVVWPFFSICGALKADIFAWYNLVVIAKSIFVNFAFHVTFFEFCVKQRFNPKKTRLLGALFFESNGQVRQKCTRKQTI